MNKPSPTAPSTDHVRSTSKSGLRYRSVSIPERQIRAYLAARDAVRRAKRSAGFTIHLGSQVARDFIERQTACAAARYHCRDDGAPQRLGVVLLAPLILHRCLLGSGDPIHKMKPMQFAEAASVDFQ